MLVPKSFAPPPAEQPFLTRRLTTGVSAQSIIVPSLHAVLERHRPCVVHGMNYPNLTSWQMSDIPACAAEAVRVVVPVSDRGEYLMVLVQYRANPGASIPVSLVSIAGVALDGGFAWSAGTGTLPSTRHNFAGPGQRYYWSYSIASSGETPYAAGVATPRPLIVPLDSRGGPVQVVLSPLASQVLSVAVYEISPSEVTP